MIVNQILAFASAFLQTCKCNLHGHDDLSKLGIEGPKLINFKNLIQHQYGMLISDNDTRTWHTFNDVANYIERKITSLF